MNECWPMAGKSYQDVDRFTKVVYDTQMAVKRSLRTRTKIEPVMDAPHMESEVKPVRRWGWMGWAGVAILVITFYWWKTNTWPIVAMIGFRPITRFEVNKTLYSQGGKTVVDNLVTERLVDSEIGKTRTTVSAAEVDERVATVRSNFATDEEFQTALTDRGLTMDEVKKQIKMQIGMEKILGDKATVSAEEVTKFITEMGSLMTASDAAGQKIEAEKILKNQKLQGEITTWIESLRTKAKIWWIGKI